MTETIFYSWQSDLPNKTNRGLIESALKQAIAKIEKETRIEAAPRLDQDTRGVPGSPDITSTIFPKIDASSSFVADVSIITENHIDRPSPNPNVLVELGYAIKALGSDRVIMVLNSHFGRSEDLPFDLRSKRTITYNMNQQSKPADSRNELSSKLQEALELVLASSAEADRSIDIATYVSNVMSEVISFLVFAEQAQSRSIDPWLTDVKSHLGAKASALRDLAIPKEASELGVDILLRDTARLIDQVSNHHGALGPQNWNEYLGKADEAIKSGKNLLDQLKTFGKVGEKSLQEVMDWIQLSSRTLAAISLEAKDELKSENLELWEELQSKVATEGERLLTLSYYDLSSLGIDAHLLRDLALEIHQIELKEQSGFGRITIDSILNSIVEFAERLEMFLNSHN